MPYHIAFVDDEPEDALPDYRKALGSLDAEFVEAQPPAERGEWDPFFERVSGVDLILLDHNLLRRVAYDGGMMGVRLRSEFPAVPIVLATRKRLLTDAPPSDLTDSVMTEGSFEADSNALAVDEVLYKSDLAAHQASIRALIEGYRPLRALDPRDRTWGRTADLLGATEPELRELRSTGLALAAGGGGKPTWKLRDFVEWVRHTLLQYPGPLLDKDHAAARLGVTPGSLAAGPLQERLAAARYAGVFADPEAPVWWRSRLLNAAEDVVEQYSGEGSRLSVSFPSACQHAGFVGVEVALCEWDGTSGVDTVCYVSRNPVKLENSLAYRADARPPATEEARVSFRTIHESNDYDERLFGLAGQREVDRILQLPDPLAADEG